MQRPLLVLPSVSFGAFLEMRANYSLVIGADLESGTTDNLAERLDKEINDIGGHLRLLVVVGRKKTGN